MMELGAETVVIQVIPKSIEQRNNNVIEEKVEKGNFSSTVKEKLQGIKQGSGRIARIAALTVLLSGCGLPFTKDSHAQPTSSPTPDKTPTTLPTPTKEPSPTPTRINTPTAVPTHTERPTATPTVKPTERPKVTELPKDIVSREELKAKYKTEIFDLPNIKFHIRREALSSEKVFEQVQQDEKLQLRFVIVDGPFVELKYLTNEQKAAMPGLVKMLQVRELQEFNRVMSTYQSDKVFILKAIDRYKEEYKKDLDSKRITPEEYNQLLDQMEKEYHPYLIDNPQPEDFPLSSAVGLYTTQSELFVNNGISEVRYIKYFLVGAHQQAPTKIGPYIFMHPGTKPLNADQSYPNAHNFTIQEKLSNGAINPYPVSDANGIPWAMRHEVAHGEGTNHPETDWNALAKLTSAFDMLKKTGDDSDFYFVWEDREQGIIIISDTPPNTNQNVLLHTYKNEQEHPEKAYGVM